VSPERDELEMPYPQYRCATCGKELPLTEARLTVTCEEHRPGRADVTYAVREAVQDDRHDIEEICDRSWGETDVDAFGRTFDVLAAENLVATADDAFAGLVSLAVDGGDLAVVLLSVYPEYQGHGVGGALIEAAATRAAEKGLPSLKVAVSNDDIPSLFFYLRHGFVIHDIAVGLLADNLGGRVPGFAGIPVRDEIRLHRPVCP